MPSLKQGRWKDFSAHLDSTVGVVEIHLFPEVVIPNPLPLPPSQHWARLRYLCAEGRVCSPLSQWWERDGVSGVFPLVSSPVIQQIRTLLKLKMGASLTSENLCLFIHLFSPLRSSGAQTGAVLGCECFFSHIFFISTLKLAPPGMLWTLSVASGTSAQPEASCVWL